MFELEDQIFENFSIQLDGRDANQVFLNPVVSGEDILKTFRVMPRIRRKTRLYFLGELKEIIQSNEGCGWNPLGNIDLSGRFIETERLKINLELCSDEFWGTAFEEALGLGLDIENNPAVLTALVLRRAQKALAKDLYKLAYWGDDTNPSPFWSLFDGIWTIIPDLVALSLVPYFNSGSGAPLAPGASVTILKNVYDQQTEEMDALPDEMKIFKVTKSVFNNYREYWENSGLEATVSIIMDGRKIWYYRGIRLEKHNEWDLINTNNGNPDTHLALLTVNQNLVLAMDVSDPGTQFKVWFDAEKEEQWYIKAKFKAGANYVFEKFMSVAY